jgi:hypothetical protein
MIHRAFESVECSMISVLKSWLCLRVNLPTPDGNKYIHTCPIPYTHHTHNHIPFLNTYGMPSQIITRATRSTSADKACTLLVVSGYIFYIVYWNRNMFIKHLDHEHNKAQCRWRQRQGAQDVIYLVLLMYNTEVIAGHTEHF